MTAHLTQTLVIAQPTEHVSEHSWRDTEEIYTFSAHLYRDGHACTFMNRVNPGSRQMISVNLGCFNIPAATEGAAIDCVVAALLDRRDATRSEEG